MSNISLYLEREKMNYKQFVITASTLVLATITVSAQTTNPKVDSLKAQIKQERSDVKSQNEQIKSQNEQLRDENKQAKENYSGPKGGLVVSSCDNLQTRITNRETMMQNSLNVSSQAIANIESSIETKVTALKTAGKDTTTLEANFGNFKKQASQVLAERQALINQLKTLQSSDCQADKKTFATGLKNFNGSFKTHGKSMEVLKTYLRQNVISVIKSLNGTKENNTNGQ